MITRKVKEVVSLGNGEYEIHFRPADSDEKAISDEVANQLIRHANNAEGAEYLHKVIKEINEQQSRAPKPIHDPNQKKHL